MSVCAAFILKYESYRSFEMYIYTYIYIKIKKLKFNFYDIKNTFFQYVRKGEFTFGSSPNNP